MADMVGGHLTRAKKVTDLFAGCGSFALRLAAKSEVHAVEGDAAALAALDRGFRFGDRPEAGDVEKRDLFRRPLTFKELNAFDGLVFDPPRAGAEDQSKQIARSDVPLVAAVSCNPVTLARDLRILIDGGYSAEKRDADRPVPVVAACRGGGAAGEAETAALRAGPGTRSDQSLGRKAWQPSSNMSKPAWQRSKRVDSSPSSIIWSMRQ